ncbi:MAG: PQQ-dependent sugar dehydrogenase [bacterium JZ-2024 1]
MSDHKIMHRIHAVVSFFFFCGAISSSFSVQKGAPCKETKIPSEFPQIALKEIASGLVHPVHITHAGDGSGRLFLVEQRGVIRVYSGGKILSKPFLDIQDRVISGGEMGLLSVAFHPEYRKNGRFFVNYTSRAGGLHSVISEFSVRKNNPNQADPDSEKILLTFPQPYANHNGGLNLFGPDGYLYISTGDGGSANDPHNNGQRLDTLLGKILRIDVNRKETGKNYAIPKDNPFVGNPGTKPEIWAYGLRNPWRFSFDPLTGLLYAGDVGQNHREEIDIVEKGRNYGWRVMEGFICTPGVNPNCDPTGLELPIWDYPREEGISVIGGFVYRGSSIPALCGAYVFGDYGSGRIWALYYQPESKKVFPPGLLLNTSLAISTFGIDENYEIYVADHNSGKIFLLVPSR